jgi:S1-C subfamily serine protease
LGWLKALAPLFFHHAKGFVMLRVLVFVVIAAVSCQARAQRPSVARITVDEAGGLTSSGSGTLIGKTANRAWVLTNAHVIGNRVGCPVVSFPGDGSYAANVLKVGDPKVDDLALLVIRPPKAEPAAFARSLDTKGVLTIAGYGEGSYREQQGRFERFLEGCCLISSAVARNGDSGGPVFDADGKLAACLFGRSTVAPETLATQVELIRDFLKATECSLADDDRAPKPDQIKTIYDFSFPDTLRDEFEFELTGAGQSLEARGQRARLWQGTGPLAR